MTLLISHTSHLHPTQSWNSYCCYCFLRSCPGLRAGQNVQSCRPVLRSRQAKAGRIHMTLAAAGRQRRLRRVLPGGWGGGETGGFFHTCAFVEAFCELFASSPCKLLDASAHGPIPQHKALPKYCLGERLLCRQICHLGSLSSMPSVREQGCQLQRLL